MDFQKKISEGASWLGDGGLNKTGHCDRISTKDKFHVNSICIVIWFEVSHFYPEILK